MKFKHSWIVAAFLTALPSAALSAAKQSSTSPKVQWTPTPFQGQITPGYKGLDLARFYAFIRSRTGEGKKGEFETTAQYDERIADISTTLNPLTKETLLAFLMPDVDSTYDADQQQFILETFHFCKSNSAYGDYKGWVVCNVGSVERKYSTYTGTNSFGASISVDKTTGTNLGFAISTASTFLSNSFLQHESYSSLYSLKDVIPMPIEEAQLLQGKKIGVLIIGRLTSAKVIDGEHLMKDPTIDSPRDTFVLQYAFPFEPVKLYYYVVDSGKVLKEVAL